MDATFKEDISIYFDENPHDGLHEHHEVDDSLREKLKCIILIPIVSQTYCDPKCFAWEHEFKVFIEQTGNDEYGLKTKLSGGNVASRVLPVKIHDLDSKDQQLFETEVGGVMRSINFIYKDTGVNRPLSPEDSKDENLNKTRYKDQVNKVANAIKGVLKGLQYPKQPEGSPIKIKPQNIIENVEKSIVVLPFVNMSNDPEQDYFSDGLTEEIITDLSQLHDLLVISRSSSMTFKESNKKIQQIAQELNVQHVLEGSVRKAGNKLRITAQLIHAETDSHLWAEKFNGTLDDIFDIQERVSRSIVEALKLKLSQDGSQKISEKPIKDPRAYDLYKKAQYEFYLFNEEGQKRAINYLKAAIDIEGQNAFLWAKLGLTYLNLLGIIGEVNAKLMDEAELCAQKVSELDPESYLYHSIKGMIAIFKAQGKAMVRHMKKSHDLNPNDTETLVFLSLGYFYLGKPQECFKVLNKLQEVDPFNTVDLTILGVSYYMNGEIDKALESSRAGYLKNPDVPQAQLYYTYFLTCHGNKEEALIILDKFITNTSGSIFSVVGEFFKASLIKQETNLKYSLPDDVKNKLRIDIEWSWLIADFYALSGNIDEAIDWLDYIVDHGFINYPLLSKHDKFLENIRQDKRYIELMARVKNEWENFSFTE